MKAYHNYLNTIKKIEEITKADVTIVPVSKYSSTEEMSDLYNNNIKTFGESRIESFNEKASFFPESNWHMIGSVQSRKVKEVVGKFTLIHSLDREKLALEFEKRSKDKNVVSNCLVQVNIAQEKSKSGINKNEAEDFLTFLSELKYVQVSGLMTMAPFTENPEEVRYVFRQLRELKEELNTRGFENIKELSMGMSNDYLIAVEEGATIVRIGSEIFK